MTTTAEKIRTAPNARSINVILPEGEALVQRGHGRVWAFTVNGSIRAEGPFDEARSAAAKWQEA